MNIKVLKKVLYYKPSENYSIISNKKGRELLVVLHYLFCADTTLFGALSELPEPGQREGADINRRQLSP